MNEELRKAAEGYCDLCRLNHGRFWRGKAFKAVYRALRRTVPHDTSNKEIDRLLTEFFKAYNASRRKLIPTS